MQIARYLGWTRLPLQERAVKAPLFGSKAVQALDYSGPERRRVESAHTAASRVLAHAVAYLIANQRRGLHIDLVASRAAIAILCDAGRTLSLSERRRAEKKQIDHWLYETAEARRELAVRRLEACRHRFGVSQERRSDYKPETSRSRSGCP